ncbi:MAG: antitoxin MazE family protein [Bifidobacteriaceae bacterium]|nr:antitoxin MazE family protein [Bifidobacteriaceae bacterium]
MATSTERAAGFRRRMAERGYRQLQLWVPDTRLLDKRTSLAAQGRAIAANTTDEQDVLDLIESWDSTPGWQ